MSTHGKYSEKSYRQLRSKLKDRVAREGLPCAKCGQPIDLALTSTHPLSFTADHIHGIADGGDLLGALQPMHLRCNSSRGGKQGAARRKARRRRYSYHEEHPGFVQ